MASTIADYMMENMTAMFTDVSDSIMTTTPAAVPNPPTPSPTSEYIAADFELLLPCIFGLVVTLALTMVSFYINRPETMTTVQGHKQTNDKSNLILNGQLER